jgi:hypothetical protein
MIDIHLEGFSSASALSNIGGVSSAPERCLAFNGLAISLAYPSGRGGGLLVQIISTCFKEGEKGSAPFDSSSQLSIVQT